MVHFDINFAERLCDSAAIVALDDLEAIDAKRTVLYLSLLSTEIALKAALEKARHPHKQIKNRSHDLKGLLDDVARCTIVIEPIPGCKRRLRATEIYSKVVAEGYNNATVGNILDAQNKGASKYPNQIRYGNFLKYYPVEVLLSTAKTVIAWVRLHWNDIAIARMLYMKQLLNAGCSEVFAKRAYELDALYEGDIEAFIALIEGMLNIPRTFSGEHFRRSNTTAIPAAMNSGNLKVELDYNGDNLTSFGFRP